ncbi:MAG: T9SS type A sorting domain-containing protein [Candidatus Latescibacteria bacterium]|nr:T9SS type A sorting domain-containing protein [Candidatus Latescibacterota bacterium]
MASSSTAFFTGLLLAGAVFFLIGLASTSSHAQPRGAPDLEEQEVRVSPDDVPAGVWPSPFAVSPEHLLKVSTTEIKSALVRQYPDVEFIDLRIVAVNADSVLYAAAETPTTSGWVSSTETWVWTSRDRGLTWNELLHEVPQQFCTYAVSLQSAALHPDGRRVFLATSHGLFLDDVPVATPPQTSSINALHISPNGNFLYAATRTLSMECEWPMYVISVDGLYRARIGEQLEWEDLTSPLVLDLAPLAGVGSDPDDPDAVYLLSQSGTIFRRTVLSAAQHGWEAATPDEIPEHLNFKTELPGPQQFLRVPHSYPAGFVPEDIDIRWGWAGYLFGHEGKVFASYSGSFSHSYHRIVIQSRDGGVTWDYAWSNSGSGWGPGDLESSVLLADAQGLLSAHGTSMTGVRGRVLDSWAVDPIDPLTAFVALEGRGLVYRTRDSGATWERVGQGLPPTLKVTGVRVDSLGTLWINTNAGIFRRSIVLHAARIASVEATPEFVAPGGTLVVAARWLPGPASTPRPDSTIRVLTRFGAEATWVSMQDDGTERDLVKGDGVYTAAIAVPQDQPFGYYGVFVKTENPERSGDRASSRATVQVVPTDDVIIFADHLAADWQWDPGNTSSTQYVKSGSKSFRVDSESAFSYSGEPFHPFGRTLSFWMFCESAPCSLQVQDVVLPDSGMTLSPGAWTHVSIPAERLHTHPIVGYNAAGQEVHPALIAELRFRSSSSVWLDDVHLKGVRQTDPTAIATGAPATTPARSRLLPAYPNPFNAATAIPYELAVSGDVKLVLYNVLGQPVRTLIDRTQTAGLHRAVWSGRDDSGQPLASGVYLCRLHTEGGRNAPIRLLLLR